MITESIAPFVHPDDLLPSRLTLSLWSGRIRFPYGLRLNVDAINDELAKSAPSASGDGSGGGGGGGVGDRIRRRGRGNSSVAEGTPPRLPTFLVMLPPPSPRDMGQLQRPTARRPERAVAVAAVGSLFRMVAQQ